MCVYRYDMHSSVYVDMYECHPSLSVSLSLSLCLSLSLSLSLSLFSMPSGESSELGHAAANLVYLHIICKKKSAHYIAC